MLDKEIRLVDLRKIKKKKNLPVDIFDLSSLFLQALLQKNRAVFVRFSSRVKL